MLLISFLKKINKTIYTDTEIYNFVIILVLIKLKWHIILIKIKKQIGLLLVEYEEILFERILIFIQLIKIVMQSNDWIQPNIHWKILNIFAILKTTRHIKKIRNR